MLLGNIHVSLKSLHLKEINLSVIFHGSVFSKLPYISVKISLLRWGRLTLSFDILHDYECENFIFTEQLVNMFSEHNGVLSTSRTIGNETAIR